MKTKIQLKRLIPRQKLICERAAGELYAAQQQIIRFQSLGVIQLIDKCSRTHQLACSKLNQYQQYDKKLTNTSAT